MYSFVIKNFTSKDKLIHLKNNVLAYHIFDIMGIAVNFNILFQLFLNNNHKISVAHKVIGHSSLITSLRCVALLQA